MTLRSCSLHGDGSFPRNRIAFRMPCFREEKPCPIGPIKWTPSPCCPRRQCPSQTLVTRNVVAGARAEARLAERAEACEKLRRLPDETEHDLHEAGLFRVCAAGAGRRRRSSMSASSSMSAPRLARVCPSTAWNFGNLASHHWMLGYCDPRIQDEIWDISPDTLIATSLAFPCGTRTQGRRRLRSDRPLAAVVGRRQFRLEHAGLHGA